MKLASHNTMSYLKPIKWYMRLFHFVGKCQDLDIVEQYKLGVRMFDLRITFINNIPYFAHGRMIFKHADIQNYLDIIESWKDCYVRIVLESPNKSKEYNYYQESVFKFYVSSWINYYKNIKFVEGTRKFDWKYLISNPGLVKTPNYIQKISSMTGSIFDDWFPRLYAIFNNKKNFKRYVENNTDDDRFVFMDFIGKYY